MNPLEALKQGIPEVTPLNIRPQTLFRDYSNEGSDIIAALMCRRDSKDHSARERYSDIALKKIETSPTYSEYLLGEVGKYNQLASTQREKGINPNQALEVLIRQTDGAEELDALAEELKELAKSSCITPELEERIVRIIARQRRLLYPADRDIERNTLRAFGLSE